MGGKTGRPIGRPKKDNLSTFDRGESSQQKEYANASFSPGQGFSLFEPDGRDLRDKYPQLNEVEEFKPLSSYDMHFTNWYANPTSPLVIQNAPDGEKVLVSLKNSYRDLVTPELREQYILHNWPDEVESAILRMKVFNAGVRNQVQSSLEELFANIKKVNEKLKMSVDALDLSLPESIDKIKNYYMASDRYMEILPKLLDQIERTGIRKKAFAENADIFADVLKKVHLSQSN